MRLSTYPLEHLLGMNYYASDTEGIGGKLRVDPEDFLVEEIPLIKKGGTSGPFLICRLTKTNWELGHAIKEIAKRLGISHRRIGWAGTKDRNAITRQWISLYNVTADQVAGDSPCRYYFRTPWTRKSSFVTGRSARQPF